jgi:transcriptional regulator with XRE-family HTH domain
MTFGEKLIKARLDRNLSQMELAETVGVSERSIYSYEQTGTNPRKHILMKLADALNVTVQYLVDDSETNPHSNIDQELFVASAKQQFGYKGAREAKDLLARASALFAGGELDDDAKDVFFQSLTEVYFESKAEAREKFTPKKKKARKQ